MLIEDLEDYIKSFSRHISDIEKDGDTTSDNINKYFEKYKITESDEYGYMGRVWILIGKKDDESPFESLMVAQSEDIHKEISADVYSMYNTEYSKQKEKHIDWNFEREIRYNLDIIKSPQIAKIKTNNNFYLYQKGHENIKKQYLYRYLHKKYKYLKIYEIDIDKYIKPSFKMEQEEKYIYELAKDYYAESKLAIETNSLFWNYYNSGVGKRSYNFFKNKRNLREI